MYTQGRGQILLPRDGDSRGDPESDEERARASQHQGMAEQETRYRLLGDQLLKVKLSTASFQTRGESLVIIAMWIALCEPVAKIRTNFLGIQLEWESHCFVF